MLKLMTQLLGSVVLSTGAMAATYLQDFTAANGTIGTGLGDGSFIATELRGGDPGPGGVFSNQLVLTSDAVTLTNSSFRIPALNGSSLGWIATFNFTVSDGPGNNSPADGFSFNYGAIPDYSVIPGGSESGPERNGLGELGWRGIDHISFQVDSWMVDSGNQGYYISGTGVDPRLPLAFSNTNIIEDGETLSATATLSWDPVFGASMSMSHLGTIFSGVVLPGFSGSEDYVFGFSARTGGATQDVIIDDLRIVTVPEPSALLLLGAGGFCFLFRRRV